MHGEQTTAQKTNSGIAIRKLRRSINDTTEEVLYAVANGIEHIAESRIIYR